MRCAETIAAQLARNEVGTDTLSGVQPGCYKAVTATVSPLNDPCRGALASRFAIKPCAGRVAIGLTWCCAKRWRGPHENLADFLDNPCRHRDCVRSRYTEFCLRPRRLPARHCFVLSQDFYWRHGMLLRVSRALPLGMLKILGCLFLVLILPSCTRTVAYRDVTGNERGGAELQMDVAACQQKADYEYSGQIAAGHNLTPSLTVSNVGAAMMLQQYTFERCMNARGWVQVD